MVKGGFKMKMEDLLNIIRELSISQGFYGRLLYELEELKSTNPRAYKDVVKDWESKNFTDSLDFIIWLEGG